MEEYAYVARLDYGFDLVLRDRELGGGRRLEQSLKLLHFVELRIDVRWHLYLQCKRCSCYVSCICRVSSYFNGIMSYSINNLEDIIVAS